MAIWLYQSHRWRTWRAVSAAIRQNMSGQRATTAGKVSGVVSTTLYDSFICSLLPARFQSIPVRLATAIDMCRSAINGEEIGSDSGGEGRGRVSPHCRSRGTLCEVWAIRRHGRHSIHYEYLIKAPEHGRPMVLHNAWTRSMMLTLFKPSTI